MEFPAGELKITMTSIFNALMEKVGNIKNQFGNFGGQVKTKKNSNQNARNKKRSYRVIRFKLGYDLTRK